MKERDITVRTSDSDKDKVRLNDVEYFIERLMEEFHVFHFDLIDKPEYGYKAYYFIVKGISFWIKIPYLRHDSFLLPNSYIITAYLPKTGYVDKEAIGLECDIRTADEIDGYYKIVSSNDVDTLFQSIVNWDNGLF